VLNNLFKRTALQQTFAGNMMAVLGGGRMPEVGWGPTPTRPTLRTRTLTLLTLTRTLLTLTLS
jgi:hypothetical protein